MKKAYCQVGYQNQGKIIIGNNIEEVKQYNGYRKITQNKKLQKINKNDLYIDKEFKWCQKHLDQIFPNNKFKQVRLCQILPPQTNIWQDNIFTFDQNPNKQYPTFISQVRLINRRFYNTLFVEKDLSQKGIYKILINDYGTMRFAIIDDFIPYDYQQKKSLFGISIKNVLQLILMKVWVKYLGDLQKLLAAQPFIYLKTFTFSGWNRFVNLTEDQKQNSSLIKNYLRLKYTIIARTKKNKLLQKYNLPENCAGFRLVKSLQIANCRVFQINSTINCEWNGQFNILDQKITHDPRFQQLKLNIRRSFIIKDTDFFQLFNVFLYTEINYSDSENFINHKYQFYEVSLNKQEDYQESEIGKKQNKRFFNINIYQDNTKIAFSIVQKQDCFINFKKPIQSQLIKGITSYDNYHRFIKFKFILGKLKNKFYKNQKVEQKKLETNYSYEFIDFSQGYSNQVTYNRYLNKGEYHLFIKPEKVNQQINFCLCINSLLYYQINPITGFSKYQKSLFLKSIFVDWLKQFQNLGCSSEFKNKNIIQQLQLQECQLKIILGFTFKQFGYGFIMFRKQKQIPPIYFELKKQQDEDYIWKKRYNKESKEIQESKCPINTQHFCLLKLKQQKKNVNWPPKGFQIYSYN